MYEQILDALRRGANAEALQAAEDAVEEHPDNPQAHRALAAALTVDGRRDAALRSIDQALALAPDDASLHFQRSGLLLGVGDIVAAQAALARSNQLDPNLLDAYIMQAQLALGRGDLDEAERLRKLAARLDAGHPLVVTIAGMLALRRGEVEGALRLLSDAASLAPDDPQVLYGLGFAYLANDNLAFAEQTFRRIIEHNAQAHRLRELVAELLGRQYRYGEGLQMLAPLLEDPARCTVRVQRLAGELELADGQLDAALQRLLQAMHQAPDDKRSLRALLEVWRRKGDAAQARQGVETLLQAYPHSADLWRACVGLEPAGSARAMAVVERWLQAMPGHVSALELKMHILDMQGHRDQAESLARSIVDLQPEHAMAEQRLVDGMIQRDPLAALHYLQQLSEDSVDEQRQRLLALRSAQAHDRAGHYDQAAQQWLQLQQQIVDRLLPLPALTPARGQWPAMGVRATTARAVAFLVGPPGALVEQLAIVLTDSVPAFRSDRLSAPAPDDPFQNYHTATRLHAGQSSGDQVVAAWQAALPARGLHDGQVLDWLPWWDNAYLIALRPYLAHAGLIVAVRDPRDMYLDWLARGAPVPLGIRSHAEASAWLAEQLQHIAVLAQEDLFPHRVVRMDTLADKPSLLTAELSNALGMSLRTPAVAAVATAMFPAGHWRKYRQALAEPFALLATVAQQLGYPAD